MEHLPVSYTTFNCRGSTKQQARQNPPAQEAKETSHVAVYSAKDSFPPGRTLSDFIRNANARSGAKSQKSPEFLTIPSSNWFPHQKLGYYSNEIQWKRQMAQDEPDYTQSLKEFAVMCEGGAICMDPENKSRLEARDDLVQSKAARSETGAGAHSNLQHQGEDAAKLEEWKAKTKAWFATATDEELDSWLEDIERRWGIDKLEAGKSRVSVRWWMFRHVEEPMQDEDSEATVAGDDTSMVPSTQTLLPESSEDLIWFPEEAGLIDLSD